MKEDNNSSKDVQNFLERFSNESAKAYAILTITKDNNLEQGFLEILDEELQKSSDKTAIEPYYDAIKHNIKKYTEYIHDKLKNKITGVTLEDIASQDNFLPKETKEIVEILVRLEELEAVKAKTIAIHIAHNIKDKMVQDGLEYDQNIDIKSLDAEIDAATESIKQIAEPNQKIKNETNVDEKTRALKHKIKIAAFSRLSDEQLQNQKEILEYNRDKYSLNEDEIAALDAIKTVIATKKQTINEKASAWVDSLLDKNLTEEEKLKQKIDTLKETAKQTQDKETKDVIIAMYYDTCVNLCDHYKKEAKKQKIDTKEYLQIKIKETEMTYIILKDQAFENLNSGNVKWYNNNMLRAFETQTLHNKYRLDLHKLEEKKEKFVKIHFRFEKDRVDHFFSETERNKQDKRLSPKASSHKITSPKVTMSQQIRNALSAAAKSLKSYMSKSSSSKTISTDKGKNSTTRTK